MYAIYADGVCIHNDAFALEDRKAISPKLTLEDNAAGSLEMTLPAMNVGYDSIVRLKTDISVEKDGEEIWAGRVLSESKDFWNNRVLYCEGELAFFNDSTQPPAEYPGLSIRALLEKLIEVHNAKVPPNRQFTIGVVTVNDDDFPTVYTNYEKTLAILNSLVEAYGGHMRVYKSNGVRYLDYLKEYPDTCTQVIQFGSNLIDFTRNWDSTEFATVIVPLGARLDDSPIEALDAYLTVESVNGGSMYVKADETFATYGWIEKTVNWDDVTEASVLLEKAQEYLKDLQFDNMEIELSALDLHYLNPDIEAVKLLDEIRVISRPHGLDRMFPVKKLEIPLDSPEDTQFTLGDTVQTSLTSVNNQTSAAIMERIEDLPKAHTLLKEAKANATEIMNRATTGYITITQDEYGSETLYITNTRDYLAADKMWKWNMNGLGYSNDGGKTWGLAITMDGAIVADYITAGVLNGDVIRTGIIRDPNSNVVLNLNTGDLTIKRGSISLGEYTDGHYNFEVDNDGNLYARRGTFAGTLSGAKGTFGGQLVAASGNFVGTVQAEDFLDSNGNSMMNWQGQFTADYLDVKGLRVGNLTIDEWGNVTLAEASISWASRGGIKDDIQDAFDAADDAVTAVDSLTYTYGGKTYIDESMLRTEVIIASQLKGGSVYLLDRWEYESGILTIEDAQTADYAIELTSYGALRLKASEGSAYMENGYDGWSRRAHTSFELRGMYGRMNGHLVPVATDHTLGQPGMLWGAVYAVDGEINTSDQNLKNSIEDLSDKYLDLLDHLRPCRYKLNSGTSGRYHAGFIAQEVEEAMQAVGLDSSEFGGFVLAHDEDGNPIYMLRYSEFISPLVAKVKKLENRIKELEARVS